MSATTPTLHLPYPEPADTADVPRDIKALAEAIDPLGTVPVGAMMMWPAASAPDGWLLMLGQTVPADAYPGLAAIFGQVGGNVTIPDMRDRFAIGAGAAAIGAVGGANSVALAANQLPGHAHAVALSTGAADRSLAHLHSYTTNTDGYHGHQVGIYGGLSPVQGNALGLVPASPPDSVWRIYETATAQGQHYHQGATDAGQGGVDHFHAVNGNTGSVGAGATHENRPAFRALNFIIYGGVA